MVFGVLAVLSALAVEAKTTAPDASIRDGSAAQASRFRQDRQAMALPDGERKDRETGKEENWFMLHAALFVTFTIFICIIRINFTAVTVFMNFMGTV